MYIEKTLSNNKKLAREKQKILVRRVVLIFSCISLSHLYLYTIQQIIIMSGVFFALASSIFSSFVFYEDFPLASPAAAASPRLLLILFIDLVDLVDDEILVSTPLGVLIAAALFL